MRVGSFRRRTSGAVRHSPGCIWIPSCQDSTDLSASLDDRRAAAMHAIARHPLYFEDITLDEIQHSSSVTLRLEEMVAFARQWDPLPVHLDEAAARAAGFAGITASGTHMLAIKQRLLHEFGLGPTVIASLGSDETRY